MSLLVVLLCIPASYFAIGAPSRDGRDTNYGEHSFNITRCLEGYRPWKTPTSKPWVSNDTDYNGTSETEPFFEPRRGDFDPFFNFLQVTFFCDPIYGAACCTPEQRTTLDIIIYANFSGVAPVVKRFWPQTVMVTKNPYPKQKIYSKTICRANLTSRSLCCHRPYLWIYNDDEPTLRQGPPYAYYISASSLRFPPLSQFSPVFELQMHPWCLSGKPSLPPRSVIRVGNVGNISYEFKHCHGGQSCDRYCYERY
ncbi:hypothetical protein [Phascolarctid gammaherpesvirus 1]|uniref:Uncharacterized protein n=1 Tax=Phascolarctid gammaherpesvirus 1 TaxID=2249313 RepID=A0A3S5HA13_9GAMA|nr:hypothetical protein KM711_gp05 [Phascolarctid gammaherpesvirus 1]AZB49181.1 hypothetical protein [Phascolarctid gammaherpesvirus 1]